MCLKGMNAVLKRELRGYFQTPVAYIFISVFLLASSAFAFYLGDFFEKNQANLDSFFFWHPWIYLFLIPAISMRLWAEERKTGTLELLLTLPIPIWQLVMGKFLAAWIFTAIALLLTFPMWISVNYLGNPDNSLVLSGYLGSLLVAGGYLAMGEFVSACTRNQVVAFVLGVALCLVFTLMGFPLVINLFIGWLPQILLETISSFGILTNFIDFSKGVISLPSVIYIFSLIWFWLFACVLKLERSK